MPAIDLKLPKWLTVKGHVNDDGDGDGDGDVELTLAEPIGFDGFEGISAKRFGQSLAMIPKGRKVTLNINTLGGQVDEGTAMHHMIKGRGNVHTNVIGYAASMGAIIFQAGETRTMQPGTMLVIHNPQGGGYGDAKQIQSQLDVLKVVKGNLVDLLASCTGQKKQDISDMMDKVTAMGPKDAKKLGFCDAIGTATNATNAIEVDQLVTICRQFNSAPMSVAVDGGLPANTKTKGKTMPKLLETLARLKIIPAADMSEDAAAVAVETAIAGLTTQREALQTENTSHVSALKARVTNRVKQAITDKKVKAEREANLIAQGITNEANLDFLDDIVVAAPVVPAVRRGAAAAPLVPEHKNATEELDAVRAQMLVEKDPTEIGRLAIKARELRGHKNLFADESAAACNVIIDGKAYPVVK